MTNHYFFIILTVQNMKITKDELVVLLELSNFGNDDIITNVTIDEKYVTIVGLTADEIGNLFEITSVMPIRAKNETITLD